MISFLSAAHMPDISPKHEIVLNVLRDQVEPISLSDLAANLPDRVSDRTLRRWLQDMANSGLVQKTGQNKGARYSEAHDTIDSSSEYLSKPVFERKPVSYNEAWLESYTPNKTYLLRDCSPPYRTRLPTSQAATGEQPGLRKPPLAGTDSPSARSFKIPC